MSSLEALNNQATALYDQAKYAEAAKVCIEALRLSPRNVHVRAFLGLCQREMGQFGHAAATFRELIAEDMGKDRSHLAFLYMMLGLCLKGEKQLKEAESALERSVEINPTRTNYFLLGHVKAKIDPASAEAEGLLRKALDLAPDYTEAYWNLADVLRCQQRHQEAIELLQYAAQADPENLDILSRLGRLLFETRQYEAAEEVVSAGLRLDEDDARLHVMLASLFMEQGIRRQETIKHLERVIELLPGTPEAHSLLGSVNKRIGKLDDAAFHSGKAEQLRMLAESVWLVDRPFPGRDLDVDRGLERGRS